MTTPDFPVPFEYAQLLWTNVVNGVGVTITASGNAGKFFGSGPYKFLGLYIAVVGAVTGTSPTLTPTITGQDFNGNTFNLVTGANITAAGNTFYVASPTGATPIVVPPFASVSWTAGGTTPSFGNVQMSLFGR